MRGINKILITGIIFSDSILIGAITTPVSIMTRIFIIATIAARGKAGTKASTALVPLGDLVRASGLRELLVPGSVLLGEPVLATGLLEPLVPALVRMKRLALVCGLRGEPVRATGLRELPALAPVRMRAPLLASINPGQPVLGSVRMKPQVRAAVPLG